MTTPLADNVEYGYSLGWSFTPLSGKRPTLNGWQARPRAELAEALQWIADGKNIGLRTGQASGLVVIDVDQGGDITSLDLPGTVAVRTGRGGMHLYYRHREKLGNSSGRLGPHIDVKADGGQVVYPGSIHPQTGRRYEWIEGYEPWTVEIAELPQNVIDKLTGRVPAEKKITRTQTKLSTNAYGRTAIKLECERVANAVEGTRNSTLNEAAFNLGQLVGGGYIPREVAEQSLTAASSLPPDETQATLTSGLDAGISKPRYIETRTTEHNTSSPRRDYILLPGAHRDDADKYVEQSNADFARQVIESLPVEAIYNKDFLSGEIAGEPGKRKWIEYTENRMRIVIDDHLKLGQWITARKTGEQAMAYKTCSKDAAGLVLAEAGRMPAVRNLTLMTSYPIYDADIQQVMPGWHNGIYYDQSPALADVYVEPDCEVIHNCLYDLVVDFPFKSDADRQNFFGLLLTPLIAPALEGNRPLHLILSPLERTGKTKLAEEVFGGVILGRQTPAMQITDRDEERDKRVIGMLLTGETLMHLDNLPPYIESSSLSSLLTATTYSGRLLGGNRIVNLQNNLTIVASGNNVQSNGEIIKRSVPILLQPNTPHPEDRRNFCHPNLRAYVARQRSFILSCLIGLIENWKAAGRPLHASKMGGFETWSSVIGGILGVNGFRAWRTNEAAWREQANPKGTEMTAFVELWHETYRLGEVTPQELRELAERNNLFENIFAKHTPHAINVAFGRLMQRHLDTPIASWLIQSGLSRQRPTYQLEPLQ
jgi:hypothetical protein